MKLGLKVGDRGHDVERLHRALLAAGYAVDAGERQRGEFGSSTTAALIALQCDRGLPEREDIDEAILAVLIEVEETVIINTNTSTSSPPLDMRHGQVTGRLVDQDGAPIVGLTVKLLSVTLKGQRALHTAHADKSGHFAFRYTRLKPLNIAVEAVDDHGDVVATSQTVFAAPAEVEINLTTAPDGVVRALSQFTVLSAAVNSALDGAVFANLQESPTVHQLSFLAQTIETSFTQVACLYIAHKLGLQHRLRDETLFGLFVEGTPPNLNAALGSLPADGIDDAFIGQILTAVLSHAQVLLADSLTSAVQGNVLPASYAGVQADEMQKLVALRVTAVGATPFIRGKTPLNDLLAAGNVAAMLQVTFVETFAANNGALGATWRALRADKSFNPTELDALNTVLKSGELLTGNLPLVKDTLQRLSDGSLANLDDLALMDEADWVTRIEQADPSATSIPQVLPNDTAADRIARFAKSLAGRFAARYPTTAFRGALMKATENSPFRETQTLVRFLAANASFDLHATSIDHYLVNNKLTINAPALAELKTAQRLHRVANYPPHVEALYAAGYSSSQAIYFKGRATFLGEMTGTMGASHAALTFARAQMTYAASLTMLARYNGAFNRGNPIVFSSPVPDPALLTDLPDLQALFGSMDSFQCDDCQSIYSPAAYLVDLLQFLIQFKAQILIVEATNANPIVVTTALDHNLASGASVTISGVAGNDGANGTCTITVTDSKTFNLNGSHGTGDYTGGGSVAASGLLVQTAQDALFLRRPEIQYVGLSCDNTNTVIPYIDLVNEILERGVAGIEPPNTAIETEGTTAERMALPQQTQPDVASAAYAATKSALFPLTLPFDQDFARTTAYLASLGGGRAALLKLFQSVIPASAITGASLGVNPAMQGIITTVDGAMPRERWGLPPNPAVVIDPNTRQPYSPNPTDWVDAMNRVPFLMNQMGLNLQQLFQLLEASWVTRNAVTLQVGTTLQSGVAVLSPDTDLMVFTGLDANVLDRINRFLRLLTACGLQMWELDWALDAAPGGVLDDDFLAFLSGAITIGKQLNLPIQEALTFWSTLGTRDVVSHLGNEDLVVPSTYTSVFLNPAVAASSSGVFVPLDQVTIAGASNALPIVITTVTPHGFQTGMVVTIVGVTGNTAANGTFTITERADLTSFSLDGIAGNGAWTGGGFATGPLSAMGQIVFDPSYCR